MKKILFSLLIFLPLISNCQIDKPIKKGNINIGGSGTISNLYLGGTEAKLFTVYLGPSCNYFFADNIAAGLTTQITYTKLSGDKSTTLGIGPNIRYYFNNGLLLRAESLYSKSAGGIAHQNS